MAVVGTFLVLGVVCGVVWWLVVEPAYFTKTAQGSEMSELELSRRFDADGWYAVIAAVVGFLAGLGLTSWRSRDFRVTVALVVLGSVLAAALTAAVGSLLGPADTEAALRSASSGARVPAELEVGVFAVYLMWPIAVLLGALMVLWSAPRVGEHDLAEERDAVRRTPGTEPEGGSLPEPAPR